MRTPDLRRVLVILDLVAVVSSWLVVALRDPATGATVDGPPAPVAGVLELGLLGLLVCLVASRLGLLRCRIAKRGVATAARLAVVALVLVSVVALVHPSWEAPRSLAFGVLFVGVALTNRLLFQVWVDAQRVKGRFTLPVVVIGQPAERDTLRNLVRFHPETGFRVVGAVGPVADDPESSWLGDTPDALVAVRSSGAGGVIIATNGFHTDELNHTLRALVHAGLHVQIWNGLLGIGQARLRWAPLAHEAMLYVEPDGLSPGQELVKRVLDITVAIVVLTVTAPITAAAALVIKLTDGGPVLFRQQRVGRNGETFTFLKLRTMRVGAEHELARLRARNERTDGPLFKLRDDPRVTGVGHILRATSVDELPQLLNVVRGQLSLVGPRPAMPDEVAQFDADLLLRLRVRPGITGLWQVEARDNPSFYLYRQLDLFYVENWSVLLDLRILLQTVPAVVVRGLAGLRHRQQQQQQQGTPLLTAAHFDPDELADDIAI